MKVAILGTVGVPGCYGGFETLAENLVRQNASRGPIEHLTVYCSGPAYQTRMSTYFGAQLEYSRWKANGVQSVVYDAATLLHCAWRRNDVALLLGVSGAVTLPFVKLFSRMRIVTNVDGIEWRRDKWSGLARRFLRLSERLAVRFSDEVVADNQGIADYLREAYGISPRVIAYGGDHAVAARPLPDIRSPVASLPLGYALVLCRIEPENNIGLILEAFAGSGRDLVVVGNWDGSDYGRGLRRQYGSRPNFTLLDPIYEPTELYRIRKSAGLYVHGHSAGGTNPSLVEMMHFGVPVMAFDCVYNRYTTENRAVYFSSASDLRRIISQADGPDCGPEMQDIAVRKYRWEVVADQYFQLIGAERQPLGALSVVNQGEP